MPWKVNVVRRNERGRSGQNDQMIVLFKPFKSQAERYNDVAALVLCVLHEKFAYDRILARIGERLTR
jgi:hypothetical protein